MRESATDIPEASSAEWTHDLPHAPGHPAAWDEESAVHTLRAFAAAERDPALAALFTAARARGLNVLVDDETLTIGSGRGAHTWPLPNLPAVHEIDWATLHDVPIALVTGSNGKTTTTRLLAAILRANGANTAHTCTDGVFLGTDVVATGDYSGPAGARAALRAAGVDAAVLETARGGILRRGLAVQHADVAVVTNVSDDHFGEYGVHDLSDLADAKLAVARALAADGTLVINADDAVLAGKASMVASGASRIAWFAHDAEAPALAEHRRAGGTTCGVRDRRLILHRAGGDHDLGEVAAMPLSFGGAAGYNVANVAAAALAAATLGVAPATIAAVLARFGTSRDDNPGRLQHWQVGGIRVFVDYAHNPDGLRGLLEVAARSRTGRLGLLLGQAGNRGDDEVRELAGVAARFAPDRIVLKDLPGFLRGRGDGEVPAVLRGELLRLGVADATIVQRLDEYEAVRELLGWARAGDVLVLPVHGVANKPRVTALLDRLAAIGWQAGARLPDGDTDGLAGAMAR
jgi:UDP-N-acetylmuramyl tripeptide synthase